MQRTDWSDLRILLAVRTAGSLAGAARRLNLNSSTVLRRIGALEKRWGIRLFERLPGGYVPTAAGVVAADGAEQISEIVDELERRLVGRDVSPSGPLRIATTDTLAASVLPELLYGFTRQWPDIRIELATGNELVSLRSREADVAIRPANPGKETVSGRRIASIAFAPYCAAVAEEEAHARVGEPGWIGYDDSLQSTSAAAWLSRNVGGDSICAVVDSIVAARNLSAANMGRAYLPCYLGDRSPQLRRMRGWEPERLNELWLLTHKDLRSTARVRLFMEAAGDYLSRLRPLFEGQRPAGAEQ